MQYYKIINGEQVFFQGNVLYTDNATIINPTHEMMLEDGWLVYEQPEYPELTEEQLLEEVRHQKLDDIDDYDRSNQVNIFYLAGQPMWLDAQTRQTLRISIESYASLGREVVTKWFNGASFTFSTEAWLQMLNALEIYAAEALNVTESHKAYINSLNNIEDIEAYDITQGYPEKLNLSVEFLKNI